MIYFLIVIHNIESSKKKPLSRKLESFETSSNLFEFSSNDYFDERTSVMRLFLEDLLDSENKYDSSKRIHSVRDSTDQYTIGNSEVLSSPDNLVVNNPSHSIDTQSLEKTKSMHLRIRLYLSYLYPDFFDEDTNSFVGEKDNYGLMVQKRGIVFYYLSRIVLYGLLGFLCWRFFGRGFQEDQKVESEGVLSSKTSGLRRGQSVGLGLLFGCSAVLLCLMVSTERDINKNFGSLYFAFQEMDSTVKKVVLRNEDMNRLDYKNANTGDFMFKIQDHLEPTAAIMKNDMERVKSFVFGFQGSKAIKDVNVPIVVLIASFLLVLLTKTNAQKFPENKQFGAFILSVLSVSFVLLSLEKIVASFSGINDFCVSMTEFGKQSVLPNRGLGIPALLGCTIQNDVFQQLYANMIAQSAALKLFNNEMYRIGRKQVDSVAAAIDLVDYLRVIDVGDRHISTLGRLLKENAMNIDDLVGLSYCSGIREWIGDSQKDLCRDSAGQLIWILGLLAGILIVFAIFAFLSWKVYTESCQKELRDQVQIVAGRKIEYGNDFEIE